MKNTLRMVKQHTIVSTRQLDGSLKFELLKFDTLIKEYNFIKTIPVKEAALAEIVKSSVPNWVFTSKKAVELFLEITRENEILIPASHKIYCLEGETLNAVTAAGFKATQVASKALDLAIKISEDESIKEVLFFCSDIRRNDLPDHLRSKGIKVNEVVLYKTVMLTHYIDLDYSAVLFFSPSAVESFFMSNKFLPGTVFFCIGNTTASALKDHVPNATVIVADTPTQVNLLGKVAEYFKNLKTQTSN